MLNNETSCVTRASSPVWGAFEFEIISSHAHPSRDFGELSRVARMPCHRLASSDDITGGAFCLNVIRINWDA